MKIKNIIKLASAILIALLIILFLFKYIDLKDISTAFSELSLSIIIGTFIIYIILNIFRTERMNLLLKRKLKFKLLFPIMIIHNMFSNLLPFRIGELSFVYFVKRTKKVSAGYSIGSLLIARIFDLIAAAVLFIIAIFFLVEIPAIFFKALIAISIILGLIILCLIFLIFFDRTALKIMDKIIALFRMKKLKPVLWGYEKIEEILESLHAIQSKKIIFWTLIFSLLIWLCQYSIAYFIFIGLGLEMTFFVAIAIVTFNTLTAILPIQGIGGFGTSEGALTIAFLGLGFPAAVAISSGFVLHIILVLYFLILGIFGLIMFKYFMKKKYA